jgi:hypothetical protein
MLTPNPTTFNASIASRPWALYSWPPVFWQANLKRRPRFVHLFTRVTSSGAGAEPCSGSTIWGLSKGAEAGLAWEWIEVADGVVAMVDPMSVITNLQLVTADGHFLPETTAALHFNQFVRRLPWQEEVQRLLRTA